MDKLAELGFTVGDVETHERYGNITHDLFGILDLVGLCRYITLGLQVTSNSNVAARVRKCLAEPRLVACLQAKWKVEVWGVYTSPPKDGRFALTRRFILKDGAAVVVEGSEILRG